MSNILKPPIKKDNVAELKKFGLLMTWAVPLFIGIIAPLILGLGLQWWTLWLSLFFIILTLLSPKLNYYPYRIWMFIGGILGWINTRIILGLTFYLLIFPLGIALKLTKKLQYKNSNISGHNHDSNYVQRTEKIDKKQLENPF